MAAMLKNCGGRTGKRVMIHVLVLITIYKAGPRMRVEKKLYK